MTNIGIIGAGGYAGVNLLSILIQHPKVKVKWLFSEEAHKGKKISELFPHLADQSDLVCQTLDDLEKNLASVDLVFLALPHGIALNYVPKILKAGKKVVDLGADYRFHDEAVFKKWYQISHSDKKALSGAVFGLPELYKEEIKKAVLVGNPGCYPTASILGLAPLVKNKLIDPDSVNIDAKSGISGAGRGASLKVHFCERNEGVAPYAVTTHRHMGEIEYQLGRLAGDPEFRVTFVPHLIPMNRGILTTIYAKSQLPTSKSQTNPKCFDRLSIPSTVEGSQIQKLYKDFYKDAPFVRILDHEPGTKYVINSNYCDISIAFNECTNVIIVMSAIDNLIKGAAGQAVQNMNLMLGYDESEGLNRLAVFP